MTTIRIEAGEPISIVVEGDTLTWLHEDVQTKQDCADLIDTETHPITKWEPLGIEGALTCSKCGLKGAIAEGTFVRIFQREPGMSQGEAYAAWQRYRHAARKRASGREKGRGSGEHGAN